MMPGRFKATAPPDAEKIGAGLAAALGARVFVDVVVPRTEIAGRMRLVTRAESISITAEARHLFDERGLLKDGVPLAIALDDWRCEIAVRHVAVAVRDGQDPSKALGSLEEWRECDDEQIAALWNRYQDLREQIDPLGDHPDTLRLSDEDSARMIDAVKKKEPSVLMSYGSRKLSLLLLTLGVPPATSATLTS